MNVELLWKEFHKPLKGYVVKRVSDESIAEDIVQDVFIKIMTSIEKLREEDKVRTWIYNITRNSVIDYYRKKKPTAELPDNLAVYVDMAEEDLSKELSGCINRMIEKLPEKYKEAIQLTEIEGMSQRQLSDQIGISFSGAKSRVQRGRAKLKTMINSCCQVEADKYGNIIDYYNRENKDEKQCQPSI